MKLFKTHKYYFFLLVIIILSTFLRLYKLGSNPPSLYWDEASLGYNAYAILTTGHDEHGESYPISRFIAFGDYKPPGYIYSIIPFMFFFGVNEFSVRLPSALSGIFIVAITFFICKELFHDPKTGIVAAALLAISPWDLQLSRAAFEAHLAAMFNIAAIWIFLIGLKKRWFLPISALMLVASFYTFNANRIIAPLIVLLLGLIYYKSLIKEKLWLFVSIGLALLLLWPNISYLQVRESRLRFQEVSIFNNLDIIKVSNERIARSGNAWWAKALFNRRVFFAKEFLIHYLDNFQGNFLFVKGDGNPRLSIQQVGELYIFELPLLLAGLIWLLRRRNQSSALIFGWLLIAPIPAGMAKETPHMLRIASILPTFQIIEALGLLYFWNKLFESRTAWFKPVILTGFTLIVIGNLFYYFHNYWIHYPLKWYGQWQYGYKQMVAKVKDLEPNYQRIEVTQSLGRPYIYFLFYNQINPLDYVKTRQADRDWWGLWTVGGFAKYDFTGQTSSGQKTLKVGTAGTFANSGKLIDRVVAPDGQTVFEIGEP